MTHKKKDCVNRPRKVGARFSNKDIAPDEYIPVSSCHAQNENRDGVCAWVGVGVGVGVPVSFCLCEQYSFVWVCFAGSAALPVALT